MVTTPAKDRLLGNLEELLTYLYVYGDSVNNLTGRLDGYSVDNQVLWYNAVDVSETVSSIIDRAESKIADENLKLDIKKLKSICKRKQQDIRFTDWMIGNLAQCVNVSSTEEVSNLFRKVLHKVNMVMVSMDKDIIIDPKTLEDDDITFTPSIRGDNIFVICAVLKGSAHDKNWSETMVSETTPKEGDMKKSNTKVEEKIEEVVETTEEIVEDTVDTVEDVVEKGTEKAKDELKKFKKSCEKAAKQAKEDLKEMKEKVESVIEDATETTSDSTSGGITIGKILLGGVAIAVVGGLAYWGYDKFAGSNDTVDFNIV
jgi:ElaB/YqjD/DUF883 family membrane-anchored ribosome-binding protein